MLPPGGEGEIKVTLTPKPGQTKIHKQVLVHTNDPEQPSFPLTMEGELLFDIEAKPASLAIREIKVGSSGSAQVILRPGANSTAKVVSVELEDNEKFAVKQLETKPDGSEVYEVTFKGRDTVGNDSTRLIVKTTGPNTPELRIPVNASSVMNLRFVQRIRFGYKNGVMQERTWRLTAREGDAPKIKKIVDPAGLLDFEISPPEGQAVVVRMIPKADKLEGLRSEELVAPRILVVHTSDREQPKIEVEYRFGPQPRARARVAAPVPGGTTPEIEPGIISRIGETGD